MALLLHSAVLATTIAASAAIGIAGANLITEVKPAVKGDRLTAAFCRSVDVAAQPCPAAQFVTRETRSDGLSVLTRSPATTPELTN